MKFDLPFHANCLLTIWRHSAECQTLFLEIKKKKKIKIISAEILPSTLSVNNGGAYRDAIKIAHNDTASLTAP